MRGASGSPKSGVGFEGEVAGLGLSDIIQLNSLNRFSGCVSVQYEDNSGLIFFRDGQIIHAEAEDDTGEAAFYEIMRWPGGKFTLQPNVTTTVRSIERSWEFLLMEACRLIDEGHARPSVKPAGKSPKKKNRHRAAIKATSRRKPVLAIAAVGVAVALAAGGVAFYRYSQTQEPEPTVATVSPTNSTSQPNPNPVAPVGKVLLRLAGATRLSAELVPALATAYLASLHVTDVRVSAETNGDISVRGMHEGEERRITIASGSPTTGFSKLLASDADIGVAARRVKQDERQRLLALGTMTSQANEHVVALDGLAVIVNRANPITILKRDQLAAIFSGTVTDWSMVGVSGDAQMEWSSVGVGGGKGGTIASGVEPYAPDDQLGLSEVFQNLALANKPIASSVKRFAALQDVADAVAANPGGIGFVPLPFVLGTKAIPIADGDAPPLMPTAFTVATEEYTLTHRLYLYTAQASKNPHVARFIQFALAPEGQAIVRKAGFVELAVKAEQRSPPPGSPPEYVKLTAKAKRLSSTFRFEENSTTFDNRAARDLDRVVDYLRDNDVSGANVKIIGFTDAQGSKPHNLRLSRDRASLVVQALAQRGVVGVTVAGLGSALPIADNTTDKGRQRNRRVEIWVSR